jgi:hypothetical protein
LKGEEFARLAKVSEREKRETKLAHHSFQYERHDGDLFQLLRFLLQSPAKTRMQRLQDHDRKHLTLLDGPSLPIGTLCAGLLHTQKTFPTFSYFYYIRYKFVACPARVFWFSNTQTHTWEGSI